MAEESAQIHLEREKARWADRLRYYKILLNGHVVEQIWQGEKKSLAVRPGSHSLELRIDWDGSPTIPLELGPGEEATLVCRPRASPFTVLYYITLGRKRYIDLRHLGEEGRSLGLTNGGTS